MKEDHILHLPNIPELRSFEDYIASSNVRNALNLNALKSIEHYEEKTPLAHYPEVRSFSDFEKELNNLGIDYTNAVICLDFDDTLVQRIDKIRKLVTPKELKRVLTSLSTKGAVFTLLTARKFEERDDINAISEHTAVLDLSTLNNNNISHNSLANILSQKSFFKENLSHETCYVNDGTTPILFADMQATHVGINNKGTVILDFMKNIAHHNPPFTIIMLDDDENVLKNMHRTLEGSGYTFIGIKITHTENSADSLVS